MSTKSHPPKRVAVIGLGLMGRRMLGSFAAHPGFDAVAGFDLDASARAAAAAEFHFAECRSLDQLLERDDLDLIYVATPPMSHVELARQVFESGRALLLEKPLAVDLESAEALVRLAESAGHPAAVNFPFATLPGLKRFERELGDGTAGAPLRVEIVLHFSQWPRTWHHAGAWLAGGQEGGFLREVFSHFAYLTQRLLGALHLVQAGVVRSPGQAETRVVADFMAGGVPVALMGGVGGAAPDFNRWSLFCEQRSYRVEDWAVVSSSSGGPWAAVEPESGESRDAASQLDELAMLLRGEASRLPTLREGLGVMRAVEALLAPDPSA